MKKLVLIILISLLLADLISASQLKVTENHPFLINNSWITAKDLKTEDLLTTMDGRKARITGIENIVADSNVQVYNLEDSKFHNYVANGVIVHNSNLPSSLETTLNVEITSRCNLACTTCPRNFGIKSDMSPETFAKILQRIGEDAQGNKRITVVSLGGRGEPTINPYFFEIIEKIRAFKESNPNVKFSMITNAQELTPAKVDAINGVIDELKISCGSTIPADYRAIHVGADPAKVFPNIEYAFRTLAGTKKTIHVTPTKYTVTDLRLLRDYFRGLDPEVNIVVFPFTSNRAGTLSSALFLEPDEAAIARLVSELKLSRLEGQFPMPPTNYLLDAFLGRRCLNRNSCLAVDSKGNYRYCINDWTADTAKAVGNAEQYSIEQAIARNEQFAAQNQFKDMCDKCNIQRNLQGFSLLRTMFNEFYRKFQNKVGSIFESEQGVCE